MERKEFISKTCKIGGCACLAMMSGLNLKAADDDKQMDWRVDFMQKRFAHLVDYMKANLDELTHSRMIEEIGRFCAQQNKERYINFTGKTEEYLKDMESKWFDKAVFNKTENIIHLESKKHGGCSCPFTANKNISPDFCNCSKGNLKEAFEVITGKTVDVVIDSSMLRGAERCCFTIKILQA